MDPKVCGKLLMLHRRGNGVDIEALRDQIPLWLIAGKGPKMGSPGHRGARDLLYDAFCIIQKLDAQGGHTTGPAHQRARS